MRKLYTTAFGAMRYGNDDLIVAGVTTGWLWADDEAEANKKADDYAHENFPDSEGWWGQSGVTQIIAIEEIERAHEIAQEVKHDNAT